MIKSLYNVNTNKLHDEFIAANIVPVLVESLDALSNFFFGDDEDEQAIDAIIAAHDPVSDSVCTEENFKAFLAENSAATVAERYDTLNEAQRSIFNECLKEALIVCLGKRHYAVTIVGQELEGADLDYYNNILTVFNHCNTGAALE
jgi:hypothetical protein